MTVRARLMLVTVLGLAAAMAVWGWVQLKALEENLDGQVGRKLQNIAETVGTYYQHFPTGQGLSALDEALRDHLLADPTLARIDVITISRDMMDYVAGAGRIAYEWPSGQIEHISKSPAPRFMKMDTEGGPALGLLYPVMSDKKKMQVCIGVVAYSQSNVEILSRSRHFLIFTSAGLLLFSIVVLALTYGWLIGRPLGIIIHTIDESGKGQYVNRIPLYRRDEWGQLADHFNSMAVEIERVLDKNQELNRKLEVRVQEATHNVVQLQKQVTQLQQLTAMGYLTANLAHDLGTPLHSIAGLAKLLLERKGWPSDVERKLGLIVQQTQRLDRVIQNVRRATRLPEPHFETVPVPELLNETLPLVEPAMQKSSIQLQVRVEEAIHPLLGDRYRMQTALLNLVQNTVEAMPAGGIVTVSAHAVTSRNSVAITVQDTGPGIPPQIMARIFEPFFSTHPEEGMKGLGLSIVQDIMKVHGGEVEIQSEPGAGTKVTLYFPVANLLPVAHPQAASV
jgi:two-component system, NtrC family, sensor kinase